MTSDAHAVEPTSHLAAALARVSDTVATPAAKNAAKQGVNAASDATGGRLAPVEYRFRPDIEGLRAVAVLLVALSHAFRFPAAGFIGVDVFFVISGFLITGLLIHEEARKGHISIARFYARRVRRILPASALMIVVTMLATYQLLGFVVGNRTANDGKWTAIFAANIHFGLSGTDYLGSRLPPSPLQNMWSLGVEEQFYVVWPSLFLLVSILVTAMHRKLRFGLTVALGAIIAASFAWSVLQTQANATWAYFSPFTRAFELAIGALLAVWAPSVAKWLNRWTAQTLAAVGILGILAFAVSYSPNQPYPGAAVAIPVVASAAVIAAGCRTTETTVGRLLGMRPMQWVGARSYSIYLWHWPFLIIPAEYAAADLPAWQSGLLLVAAITVSAISYRLMENPIRHSRFLKNRTGLSLAFGAVLILLTIGCAQWQIATHYGTWNPFMAAN